MAVDSKQGSNKPSPATTLAGIPALSGNGVANKRRRPSSLMAVSASLPSVESSLDEFIAKANETLVDPSSFNSEAVRREEDEKRKEQDALRWKATEQQMRESQAREESLRRQLDGLQGQLAEAEARAAVASSGGSQDGVIADLRLRLSMAAEQLRSAEEKARTNEAKVGKLEQEVVAAKATATAVMPVARESSGGLGIGDAEAEERIRIAEAKAAKALAAAKAASAGLTVSPDDLAAIESGLSVAPVAAKKPNWGLIAAAFVVGGAIMFVAGYMLTREDKKSAPAAAAQPAAKQEEPEAEKPEAEKSAKSAKPTVTPTVTPIDDEGDKPAPSAKAADDSEAKDTADDEAAAKAEKAAADDAAAEAAKEAAAAKETAAKEAAAQAKAQKAAKKPAKKAPAKKAAKKSGALADPFGDGDAPAPKKKKGGSGIVDPF